MMMQQENKQFTTTTTTEESNELGLITTTQQEKKQVTRTMTEKSKVMTMTQQEKEQVTATTTEQSKECGWICGESSRKNYDRKIKGDDNDATRKGTSHSNHNRTIKGMWLDLW